MGIETAVIAGITISALATGYGVYSSERQAASADALAQFNAQQERNKGAMAQQEAQAAAQAHRTRKESVLATLRAQQAERGVTGVGSAVEQLTHEAKTFEAESLDMERQGHLAKAGYNTQAQLHELQGRSSKRASRTQSITQLSSFGGRAFNTIADLN